MKRSYQLFGAVLLSSFAACASAQTADLKALTSAMKQGGYVVVFRHGATNRDQADTDPLNFGNISAQRNLNDKGKALAKAFGDALRQGCAHRQGLYQQV